MIKDKLSPEGRWHRGWRSVKPTPVQRNWRLTVFWSGALRCR